MAELKPEISGQGLLSGPALPDNKSLLQVLASVPIHHKSLFNAHFTLIELDAMGQLDSNPQLYVNGVVDQLKQISTQKENRRDPLTSSQTKEKAKLQLELLQTEGFLNDNTWKNQLLAITRGYCGMLIDQCNYKLSDAITPDSRYPGGTRVTSAIEQIQLFENIIRNNTSKFQSGIST